MNSAGITDLALNTIRFLAVDAVEKAKSGHPGTPMGSAEIAYLLWMRHMRYNPRNPHWANRDRFVLSAGHASMLLYSMLYLTGYDLSLDDIKQFRQLGSRTPGHPECGHTPGVETTTGPLGQGFGVGVGMAIAERYLRSYFNRPGHDIVDYHIYSLCSDGDMMEGLSSEAASLAGHLGLNKLIYIYSDNRISIEGSTELAFTEDVSKRFEAYGWFVQDIDGHDMAAIDAALETAKSQTDRPSLIRAHSHIGYGSPEKQDSADAHGEPLGPEEAVRTKQNLGWPIEPAFLVPDEVLEHMHKMVDKGAELEQSWEEGLTAYRNDYPDLGDQWVRAMSGELPEGWENRLPILGKPGDEMATRDASGKVMNAIAPTLPFLIGGSADLAPSTKTYLKDFGDFTRTESGHNMHFGVREHAMGACLNGMALTHPIIPFGGTFLIFSDYMRPTIRLAALMRIRVIYVFTHDSVFLGEDGPTHEPIEQLASLRAIPNMTVIRPADAAETVAAWKTAIKHKNGPVALVLSRQKLPILDRTDRNPADMLAKGAYVLWQAENAAPDIILISTGSEVHITLEGAKIMAQEGINAQVVSMPSWELFEAQSQEYRDEVLPPSVTSRLAVEAASPMGWTRYTGTSGDMLGMTRFGESAPYKDLQEYFGFTPENVAARARALLNR
ncbi:MAG: transketolase [Armatimonadota bacterium]